MKKWRVTILLVVLLILSGIAAMISVPKESSPSIDFGIIVVTTSYPGASPEDVDDAITEEIEQAIEGIDGIDKIETTSTLGLSSVTVTLTTEADITQTLTDIQNSVDTVSLPDDANDPVVVEIETDTERMFDVVLYAPMLQFSQEDLFDRGVMLQQRLEAQPFIGDVTPSISL
jgi:multidrug efflux pump subunit AcrB